MSAFCVRSVQLARGQRIVVLNQRRGGGKAYRTVDSYEGTFHTIGLNRVRAYLLLADWGSM
jgi:hypothetical protein